MATQNTIWPIEPHTLAKHHILARYWRAWLPIMASWNDRLLYIDGFAGPGQYSGGEPGSPIIVLDEALNHRAPIRSQLDFLFIESDRGRSEYLRSLLSEKLLPSNYRYRVFNARFDEFVSGALDLVDQQQRRLAPAFVLVDPFGYSQTPFEIIQRLLANERCELMITFMYQFINRFISETRQHEHLDRLYGTREWRNALTANSSDERRAILHGVYREQLERKAGVRYVLPFEMEDPGGQTEYFLFFCTNSIDGLSKMKDAMWAVDPTGNFRYAYASNPNQLRLLDTEPDFASLSFDIFMRFRGETVSVEEVEEFVLVGTPFLSTHYKMQVLRPLERAGRIEVVSSTRRRSTGYPAGTMIRFDQDIEPRLAL